MPATEKFVSFPMATPRPVMHISREEIYTDLEKRIEYLQSFLDFSSRTYHPQNFSKSQLTQVCRGCERSRCRRQVYQSPDPGRRQHRV